MTEFTINGDAGCMDDSDPSSLPLETARARILGELSPNLAAETIPLQAAARRILAEDLIAGMDVPSATNSAMDGYAINSAELPASGERRLQVAGVSWAGKPWPERVSAGNSVRIMTGALLPEGTDTVVMQEHTRVEGDSIIIDNRTLPGENIRPVGEDIRQGTVLLSAGCCIYPAHLGLIASQGLEQISVRRRVRIACFSTGDELCDPGEPLLPGSIYDSNRPALAGLLNSPFIDFMDLGRTADDPVAIASILNEAAGQADVIIASGGVSVGDADHVKTVLEQLGSISFWKVAIKPGRPLAFGKINGAAFFGLPGNPVSAMVTCLQLVIPAIHQLAGANIPVSYTFRVPCQSNLKKRPGRLEYQRGILTRADNGDMVVRKTGEQGSGILSSMAEANCFIILPVENDGVIAGETVEVQPFHGLI